jgi:hypothetical protein
MNSLESQKVELKSALDRSEAWLNEFGSKPDISSDMRTFADSLRAIGQLRPRADSELLNVAMFGATSSGKTFLVSGLQGGLGFVRVPSVDGVLSDKYIGLLPSATTQATACSASVVPANKTCPLNTSGRGFLQVRFTDTNGPEWEDIGNSLPPSVIAAYAMFESDPTGRMHERDYLRQVAEVKVLLGNYKLPAKLYDLPGFGSGEPIHDAIVMAAMAEADCIIYIANATRAIRANVKDLDLIGELYERHLTLTRKPIIWVLTAIDLAANLGDDNKPAWMATRADNDRYLREKFTRTLSDGSLDTSFIGAGFIAVSPALEAQGDFYLAQDEEARGREMRAASRMDFLRTALDTLISEESGPRHLTAIAKEAYWIVEPLQRVVSAKLATERLPYDRLATEREEVQKGLKRLDGIFSDTRSQLQERLDRHIRTAARSFVGLADYLHQELDGQIRGADLSKRGQSDMIKIHKVQALNQWINLPDGPASKWESEFSSFEQEAVSYVRSRLGEDVPTSSFGAPPPFDFNQLTILKTRPRPPATLDMIRKGAAAMAVVSPIAAAATLILTTLAVTTVALPAAAVAGIAGSVYMIGGAIKGRKSQQDSEREQYINRLDAEADEAQQVFLSMANAFGQRSIDSIMAYLANYRSRLEQNLEDIRLRMSAPANRDRKDLIEQLELLNRAGEELLFSLLKLGGERS